MTDIEETIAVDLDWCVACRDERAVEIVLLAGEPAAMAVCADCGNGTEAGAHHPDTVAETDDPIVQARAA